MYIVPGKKLGKTVLVKDVPDGSLEIPYMCEGPLHSLEELIERMVKGASRKVVGHSLEYDVPGGKAFLRVRFREKSLRLIFPGNSLTFVDAHHLVREMPVPEWGDSNVEFDLKKPSVDILKDYLTMSLSLIDYYAPPKHDEDEDDEYTIELTDGKYEGPVVGGKPHGVGKFTWNNGSRYEGSFVNGAVCGEGKYTSASGDVFEGKFVNGKISEEKKTETEEDAPAPLVREQVFTFGYIF